MNLYTASKPGSPKYDELPSFNWAGAKIYLGNTIYSFELNSSYMGSNRYLMQLDYWQRRTSTMADSLSYACPWSVSHISFQQGPISLYACLLTTGISSRQARQKRLHFVQRSQLVLQELISAVRASGLLLLHDEHADNVRHHRQYAADIKADIRWPRRGKPLQLDHATNRDSADMHGHRDMLEQRCRRAGHRRLDIQSCR